MQQIDLRGLALSPILSGNASYSDIVRAAQAGGFARVRLAIPSAAGKGGESRPTAVELRELKAALRDSGVSVLDVGLFELGPAAGFDLARRRLELAAELGAPFLCCIGAPQPAAEHFLAQQRVDDFGKVCDEAAQFGVAVALEYAPARDIGCFEDAANLVRAAGRANAAPVLDILDLARSDCSWPESAQLAEQGIAFAKLPESARALGATLAFLPPDICLAVEERLRAPEPALHIQRRPTC